MVPLVSDHNTVSVSPNKSLSGPASFVINTPFTSSVAARLTDLVGAVRSGAFSSLNHVGPIGASQQGSRHVIQLASSRGIYSLSGNAALLESIQYKVHAPSSYPASSQTGSSQSQVPNEEYIAGSTRVATGSEQTGYVCGNWTPSSKPGS
jgi:hypothetical protein